MRFTGNFVNVVKDWQTGVWQIIFTVNEEAALEYIGKIIGTKLEIVAIIKSIYLSKERLGNQL